MDFHMNFARKVIWYFPTHHVYIVFATILAQVASGFIEPHLTFMQLSLRWSQRRFCKDSYLKGRKGPIMRATGLVEEDLGDPARLKRAIETFLTKYGST